MQLLRVCLWNAKQDREVGMGGGLQVPVAWGTLKSSGSQVWLMLAHIWG